jgi:NAD(P)-dependent dehydrogenase (short-subunit alcohol dehydrogenase family)
MQGRVAVVTGGTSGAQRSLQVADALRRSSGNSQVEAIGVDDLSTRAGWTAVSEELLRRLPKIHVLVNNAGAVYFRREVTVDGFERTFALNVLAPLALTVLLQERLRNSAPARVVNVSSAAHEGHSLDLRDLQSHHRYSGFQAYGRSKLELILLSRELALRFAGTGVTVNSLHPGFIRSGWARNNRGGAAATIRFFALLFGKSPRNGAKTPLRVAGDPDLDYVSGEYFSHGHVVTGSRASRDLSSARRLYEACLPLTGGPDIPLPTAFNIARR